jgi:8-amino-7-oxononanoate synthase
LLDFTSALYLDLRHASLSLSPWATLTTGVPAALGVPVEAVAVAERAASLVGCERAVLVPSTLHLFWDLFPLLASADTSVHIDLGAYPIARWGVERLQARGIPVQSFRHYDPGALREQLRRAAARRRRPLVLVDGYCPGCGPAPLSAYGALAQRVGGRLVIDDTQAVGVLGEQPGFDAPFGRGGGGSLRRHGIAGPHIVVGASLAKGFGAPLAVLAGGADIVDRFEHHGETRMHCSQPSLAAILAAQRALQLNRDVGDAVRARLGCLVQRFTAGAANAGFSVRGGVFPVQTVDPGWRASGVHARLGQLGVRAVLHRAAHGGGPLISFAITARHDEADIDAAIAALASATGAPPRIRHYRPLAHVRR